MFRVSIRELMLVTIVVALLLGWCVDRQTHLASRVSTYLQMKKGAAAEALDPPTDEEVVRAWQKANSAQGGLPFLHETERKNVRIVKEKISDYVDPVRVVPLIGSAQVHHVHYKCTIYCTQVTKVAWPVQHTLTDENSQDVIYIDRDQIETVGTR